MPRSMRGTDLMYKVKNQTIENMLGVKPDVKWNFCVFKLFRLPAFCSVGLKATVG